MSPPERPSAEAPRFRFIPRYRALAISAMAAGATIIVAAGLSASGASLAIALGAGCVGCGLGALYLLSPTWRIVVTAGDAGLAVHRGERLKFQLAWNDIERVVTTDARAACYVRGDSPKTSLLIPGPEAPAPYDIDHKVELVAIILERAPADRIDIVDSMRVSPLLAKPLDS